MALVVTVAVVCPAVVAAAAPTLAAPIAAAITGAVTGATAYTASTVAINTVNDQAPLEGWDAVECATSAAGGALLGYGTSVAVNALTNAAVGTTTSATTASSGSSNTSTAVSSYYPPDNGALNGWSTKTFSAGDTFSRVGGAGGNYGFPVGQATEMVSLPYDQIGQPATNYVFNMSYQGSQSIAAPWFGQVGNGTQYYWNVSIEDMLQAGIISIVP